MLNDLLFRLRALFRKQSVEIDLEDELQFHVQNLTRKYERTGLSPEEASRRARIELGGLEQIKEETRQSWGVDWIESSAADCRYAMRSFARRRTFAVTAISCLAIGIAANVLVFSLINGVLLRDLPYPSPDRLVSVRFSPPDQPEQKLGSNSGTYFYVRDHSDLFERTGAIRITGFSASPDSMAATPPEWIQGAWTSTGMTALMGVEPTVGTWYADQPVNDVVISYGLWKRMYRGASDVVGKKIFLDRVPFDIVGVAPEGFQTLNSDIDLWRPQPDGNLANALRSPNRVFFMFGRLKPGVTIPRAQAALSSLASGLGQEFDMNRGWAIRIESLRDTYVGYMRRPLIVLQGAVFLLLLVACANAASLLLAQAANRQKEFAVRASLGSTRGRLIRQLLVENTLLSVIGGSVGAAAGWFALQAVTGSAFASSHNLRDISLDWRVLAFALAISLATGLMFGMIPALQVSRPDLMKAARESGRSLTASVAGHRLRGMFVVAQVALALVLLTGSGLLIRTLIRLNTTDTGLNPRHLAVVQVPFSRTYYKGTDRANPTGGLLVEFDGRFAALSERVRGRLEHVPGVLAATAAVTPPLGPLARRVQFSKEGVSLSESERGAWAAEWYPVSAGYFETLQIPLKKGRPIDGTDRDRSQPVAVISDALARQFFPNQDPIGQKLQLDILDDPPREIVGVVSNIRQDRYQASPQAQVYVPRTQLPLVMDMTMSFEILVPSFIVRTSGDPAAILPALRAAIHETDGALAVASSRSVEDYAASQLEDVQEYATLLSIFGAISVLLALTGIFGAMASTVTQRTNEIGIRVALGASRRDVLVSVLRHGFVLVVSGLGLGLLVSAVITPAIRSLLWGVSATDPLTFGIAAGGLAAIAMIACYFPALRALSIEPVVALRTE